MCAHRLRDLRLVLCNECVTARNLEGGLFLCCDALAFLLSQALLLLQNGVPLHLGGCLGQWSDGRRALPDATGQLNVQEVSRSEGVLVKVVVPKVGGQCVLHDEVCVSQRVQPHAPRGALYTVVCVWQRA